MLLLAINTASSQTAIALLENGSLISEKTWPSGNREAELLMPEIDKMLTSFGKNYHDLSGVIVVKGPGSFTGLRVGITVANTIAHLQKIPLYALDSFDLWHLNELNPSSMLLIFAGKGGVYIGKNADTAKLYSLDEAKIFLREKQITNIYGDITPEQKNFFSDQLFEESNKTFGQTVEKFASGQLIAQTFVEPLYIKPPAISEQKKNLF